MSLGPYRSAAVVVVEPIVLAPPCVEREADVEPVVLRVETEHGYPEPSMPPLLAALVGFASLAILIAIGLSVAH